MATSEDLAIRVLEKLLIVGAGQSPEDEDLEKVQAVIPRVFDTLSEDTIYTVSDADDIASSAFEWLAIVVAFYCATDFGKTPDGSALEYAEQRLRRLVSTQPSYEVLTPEYF